MGTARFCADGAPGADAFDPCPGAGEAERNTPARVSMGSVIDALPTAL